MSIRLHSTLLATHGTPWLSQAEAISQPVYNSELKIDEVSSFAANRPADRLLLRAIIRPCAHTVAGT